ncbi:hypothetical protein N7456_011738 [Penicillium angulare]|uniref:Uncharacterized protein n=1 Tax=Penicillium angulare TaxID=116970 RepID=A0A9W9EU80_9EURO|nr:hypothetical protein N7456_011738 [Penicillium angulare]
MPRPARRNRSTKAPEPTDAPKARDGNDPKSPATEHGSTLNAQPALRNQTPLAKSNEQAIESSPAGNAPGTGSRPGTSRPPTRSRGYSSTLSLAGRTGDANSRVPGTPGFDTSVLGNFRRRPRQQSILQMMQAEEDSSDVDEDDFLGGLSPQDESTPLNASRGKSLLAKQGEESASPSQSLPSSGGSHKRKRVEVEVQVPMSSIEDTQAMVPDSPSATPIPDRSRFQVSDETPQPMPFSDILSQTMAPPASSPMWSTQSSIAANNSPAVHQRNSKTNLRDVAHMSTAALQNKLLPRRRQRRRKQREVGEMDIPSDESDDDAHNAASGDEDELNYLPPRRKRQANTRKSHPLGSKPAQVNQKQKKTRAKSVPNSKPSGPQGPQSPRLEGIDKENESRISSPTSSLSSPPESDASDSESEVGTGRRYISEELRAAAKKFAEVDKWQMEFEEVSASETPGSPIR